MFNVGDRVVYPMHGAGFIEGTVKQTIGGQQKEYYDIRIHGGNIRLKLPVDGPVRLRNVMDRDQAQHVLEYFRALEIDMSAPWGKRYKENMERLKVGTPEDVAGVVKALMLRDKNPGLSTGDRQVMVTAKNILCSELSLALDLEVKEVQNKLQDAVNEMIG
ncbi:MAG: CarD family transcriptional regulator [Clostridia bacterium]|nr:CarD family transcriptional regulator [Clostridia bacterium]